MQAIIFDGPNRLRLAEVDAPRIEEPGDALVRVRLSGISGSNVRAFTGEWQRDTGNVMGFEYVGEVIETGSGVHGVQVGQRVIGPFSVHCGDCYYCKLGIFTACENRMGYGRQLSGTHAEIVRVPRADSMLEVVPENVSDQQAILATDSLPGPLAGLESAGLKAGESVLVLGCGPVGLCTILLARSMGAATVIAVDHRDYRLKAAEAFGAHAINFDEQDVTETVLALTAGRGADLVAECVGRLPALVQAIESARPRGRILGLGDGWQGPAEVPLGDLMRKHLTLIPCGVPPVRRYFPAALRLLQHNVIDPTAVVSHELPLARAQDGYELMAGRKDGALKVVLRP